MRTTIGAEPLATLEYAALVHPQTLVELTSVDGPALALVAAQFGSTHLIDNLLIGEK